MSVTCGVGALTILKHRSSLQVFGRFVLLDLLFSI